MKIFADKNRKICQRNHSLYLANSDIFGRGVFCHKPLKNGDLIEECPLIIFQNEEVELVKNTVLYNYYFIVQTDPEILGLAMGYGSVYNHQCPANAGFRYTSKNKKIEIFCARDIDPGTEITINYNGNPDDPSPVHFDVS